MQRLLTLISLFLLLSSLKETSAATTDPPQDSTLVRDSIRDTLITSVELRERGLPEETFRKKKLITAILAFPIPFGFVGLHRIYLGSEPWVPIAYLCTGGGGCGLLPLLDFIYIVTANEEEFKKYENNPKLIMFVD
jgi:TM2 domain-containing membrane protein YozV